MGAEKVFEKVVKKFLKDQNAWFLKTWSNGIQRQGVPDIIACYQGRFVAIELKAENGKPSQLQIWNVETIRESGGIAIVLYPDQYEMFKRIMLNQFKNMESLQYQFDKNF